MAWLGFPTLTLVVVGFNVRYSTPLRKLVCCTARLFLKKMQEYALTYRVGPCCREAVLAKFLG